MFDKDVTVTVDAQVQKQEGHKDCGNFCIAIATSLLYDLVPSPFIQSLLRFHLIHCFENKLIIKMSGSESRPRKVELASAHKKTRQLP